MTKLTIAATAVGMLVTTAAAAQDTSEVLCAGNTLAFKASTPKSQFIIDDENGTVTDRKTGLMWPRCELGKTWEKSTKTCSGEVTRDGWREHLEGVEEYSLAGFDDWRLPNLHELMSIVETQCSSPALNAHLFPGRTSYYYDGYVTNSPNGSSYVWAVNLFSGEPRDYRQMTDTFNAWPVRVVSE
jgi:hypothetical protein